MLSGSRLQGASFDLCSVCASLMMDSVARLAIELNPNGFPPSFTEAFQKRVAGE
jgi:hypothetical protein